MDHQNSINHSNIYIICRSSLDLEYAIITETLLELFHFPII